MKFIGRRTNSAGWYSNVLTDGQSTCSYEDISPIFEEVQNAFKNRDISREDCIALECSNTLQDALILLFLLEEGYHFLLLPNSINPSSQSPNSSGDLPQFCRYSVKMEDGLGPHNDRIIRRESLQITPNDSYEVGGKQSSDAKLYLRTSGSTGTPKIAVHSHVGLVGNITNCIERLQISSEDRIAIPVPLYHMFGLGAAFLPGVAAGASIDLQKGANIIRYIQREQAFSPNVVFITPVFGETLVKGRRNSRKYRLTVSAGDRFRSKEMFTTYESLFGCLIQLYGSTEMGAISASDPADPIDERSQTVGKPMPGVQLRIERKNSESDRNQDVGELWCNHPYGFEGYIDAGGNSIPLPHLNRGNWWCTRDMGKIRSDGRMEVMGRCDHSINRDGLLVFFAEGEKKMETIDGIDSAVITSSGEGLRGRNMIAFCVLQEGGELSKSDIRSACFATLPKHAVPDRVEIIPTCPLLPNGKVDRQKLQQVADGLFR